MNRASSGLVAAAGALATAAALRRREPTVTGWRRRNFRGRSVTVAGGPALAVGVLAGAAGAGATGALVAGATGAGLGLYDDLRGDVHARGLRGHWHALRAGRVTTGLVKLTGLVVGGVTSAVVTGRRGPLDRAIDGTIVAGSANLVNLLDLRPGRALKVVAASGLATAARGDLTGVVASGVAATAIALMPADLAEQQMIGDCGANAAGAVLGWGLATRLGRPGRVATLVALVALTLASERVSFSDVIEGNALLRAVDRWGRRP